MKSVRLPQAHHIFFNPEMDDSVPLRVLLGLVAIPLARLMLVALLPWGNRRTMGFHVAGSA